jgi:hypothetical protein
LRFSLFLILTWGDLGLTGGIFHIAGWAVISPCAKSPCAKSPCAKSPCAKRSMAFWKVGRVQKCKARLAEGKALSRHGMPCLNRGSGAHWRCRLFALGPPSLVQNKHYFYKLELRSSLHLLHLLLLSKAVLSPWRNLLFSAMARI